MSRAHSAQHVHTPCANLFVTHLISHGFRCSKASCVPDEEPKQSPSSQETSLVSTGTSEVIPPAAEVLTGTRRRNGRLPSAALQEPVSPARTTGLSILTARDVTSVPLEDKHRWCARASWTVWLASVLSLTACVGPLLSKQDYRADGYRDYGVKKIVLVKKGDDWKIKKEEWQAPGG